MEEQWIARPTCVTETSTISKTMCQVVVNTNGTRLIYSSFVRAASLITRVQLLTCNRHHHGFRQRAPPLDDRFIDDAKHPGQEDLNEINRSLLSVVTVQFISDSSPRADLQQGHNQDQTGKH